MNEFCSFFFHRVHFFAHIFFDKSGVHFVSTKILPFSFSAMYSISLKIKSLRIFFFTNKLRTFVPLKRECTRKLFFCKIYCSIYL